MDNNRWVIAKMINKIEHYKVSEKRSDNGDFTYTKDIRVSLIYNDKQKAWMECYEGDEEYLKPFEL